MDRLDLVVVPLAYLAGRVGKIGFLRSFDCFVYAILFCCAINSIFFSALNRLPCQLHFAGGCRVLSPHFRLLQIPGTGHRHRFGGIGSRILVDRLDLVVVTDTHLAGGIGEGGGSGGLNGLVSAILLGGAVDGVFLSPADLAPGQFDFTGGRRVFSLHFRPGQITGAGHRLAGQGTDTVLFHCLDLVVVLFTGIRRPIKY